MPSMEDDYLDRARELWQEYQFYVYVGLAMILATITGFTLSHSSHEENRKLANEQLYMLINSADQQEEEEALAAYAVLTENDDFPELGYLGAFVLSSVYFDKGDYTQAAEVLAPALAESTDNGVRSLAALRMAEALISTPDSAARAATLLIDNMPDSGRLQVLFEERLGDAEYASGNLVATIEAYRRALSLAQEGAQFYQPLLNIKLGALLSNPEVVQALQKQKEKEYEERERAAADAAALIAESEESAVDAEGAISKESEASQTNEEDHTAGEQNETQ